MVLSCQCLITGQTGCNGTTWVFSSRDSSIELVTLGKVNTNLQTKSNRLSVAANCSLVIRNISVEDVGYYECQQYKSGVRQDHHNQVNRCGGDLSVVHSEYEYEVILLCYTVYLYYYTHFTVEYSIFKIMNSFIDTLTYFVYLVYNLSPDIFCFTSGWTERHRYSDINLFCEDIWIMWLQSGVGAWLFIDKMQLKTACLLCSSLFCGEFLHTEVWVQVWSHKGWNYTGLQLQPSVLSS